MAAGKRPRQLEQRDVGGGAMREQGLQIELRMRGDLAHIEELRRARRVELDELVVGAGLHAVRGGEHQVARNRGAGAERAARADDHHRVPALQTGAAGALPTIAAAGAASTAKVEMEE